MSRRGSTRALSAFVVLALPWCGRVPATADAQARVPSDAAVARRYVAMAGGDARHTGRSAWRGPRDEPRILWRVRTRRRVFASPVVDEAGRVVFASLDGSVLAVDRRGVVCWAFAAPDRVFSAPAVTGELTVFGHDGDRVVAVDARGRERWSFHTSADADAAPVVADDGTVYVASGEAACIAADGRVRWSVPLRSHAFGAPALSADGTLYVTELGGAVTLLRTDNGATLHRIELPAPVHGGVTVLDDGGFVVGADDGHVRAFSREGAARWDVATQGAREGLGVRATPALSRDGVVIIGADDGGIYGLRAADGTEAFRVQTALPVRSSARIDAEGWAYIGSEDDTLRALDATGAVRWSVMLGADIDGAPALTQEGTIVVGADDGALYALGAR